MGAFFGCERLTDVYCHTEKVPSTGNYVFSNSPIEYATLYVPESAYYDYKEAAVWKKFGTITTLSGNIPAFTHDLIYMVDGEEYKRVKMEYKSVIVPEDIPTKEGHTFSGWSEVPETMPLHDITVTGIFTINKYLVTFKIGEEVIAADSLVYGATIVAPEVLQKEGYTFNDWKEMVETVPANDVTIEGSYSVNSYLLTYLVDGEEYATDSIAYGESIVLIEVPTKEGYTFSGWSEVPETMPAQDITVTGSFEADGIEAVLADKLADVYTLQGIKVKTQIPVECLYKKLPTGIYIINRKKVMVK